MSNKLVIKESEWGQQFLCRTDDGKKCCLGFWAEQLGNEPLFSVSSAGHRYERSFPNRFPDVQWDGEQLGDGLSHTKYDEDTGDEMVEPRPDLLQYVLANINDSDLPLDEKKRLITLGFAQIGIEVEFVP